MPDDLTPVVVSCGRVVIRVWPDSLFLETRWPDGATVGAGPNYDAASVALAARLGYSGPEPTWAMSRDHETLHSWLAVQEGADWSPTLYSVAHNTRLPKGLIPYEESKVLALQSLLNDQPADPAACAALERDTGRPLPTLVAQARSFLATLQEV